MYCPPAPAAYLPRALFLTMLALVGRKAEQRGVALAASFTHFSLTFS